MTFNEMWEYLKIIDRLAAVHMTTSLDLEVVNEIDRLQPFVVDFKRLRIEAIGKFKKQKDKVAALEALLAEPSGFAAMLSLSKFPLEFSPAEIITLRHLQAWTEPEAAAGQGETAEAETPE